MAKAFSVASWNVEHFRGKPQRVARVVDFLRKQKPDVFAALEVEGKGVFDALITQMPGYQFQQFKSFHDATTTVLPVRWPLDTLGPVKDTWGTV